MSQKDLEEREDVMSLNMNYKLKDLGIILLLSLLITGCSSKPIVPTTDICSVKKHWRDNVFQILINDEPINKRWYIHSEAMDITKLLGAQNKCMI